MQLDVHDTNTVTVIITALGSILAALGLPKLYEQITARKKIKLDSEAQEELEKLRQRIIQIETSVEMLLLVIKDEFKDNEAIQNVIEKVAEHIHVTKKDINEHDSADH